MYRPPPIPPVAAPPAHPHTHLTERQFVLDLLNRHNVSFTGDARMGAKTDSTPVSLTSLRLSSAILLRRPELLTQGFLEPFLMLHGRAVSLDDPNLKNLQELTLEGQDSVRDMAFETGELFFVGFVDDVVRMLFQSCNGNFRGFGEQEVSQLRRCLLFVRKVVAGVEGSDVGVSGVEVRCAVVEFLIRHLPGLVRVVVDTLSPPIQFGKRQELWDVCESLKKVIVRWTVSREPLRLQIAAIRFVTLLITCFTPLKDDMTGSEVKTREAHVPVWCVDHHDGSSKWCLEQERIAVSLTDLPLNHDVFQRKRQLLWIDTQMLWKLLRDRLFPSETPLLVVTTVLSCMLLIGKLRRHWWDELVRTFLEYQEVVDRRCSQERRGVEDEDGDVSMVGDEEEEEEEEEGGEGAAADEKTKTKLTPIQRLSLQTVLKFSFLYLFNIPVINRLHRERLIDVLLTNYAIPDDYVMRIVSFCDKAKPPISPPAVSEIRKRKRLAFEEADSLAPPRKPKAKKKPKLETITTPLGPKTPLELANIVVANLLRIATPPPPIGALRPSREAFLQCLFKMCNVLHPTQRSVIQRFASVLLVQEKKRRYDADGDAGMGQEGDEGTPEPAEPSLHIAELNVNFEPTVQPRSEMEEEDVQAISEMAWKKLLDSDLESEGCEDLRHSIIVRHVVACPSEHFVTTLMDNIKHSIGTRFSLLMRWLYAEYLCIPYRPENLYDRLFSTFLDFVLDKEKWKLKDFVVMAPRLIPGAVEKVLSLIYPPNNLPKLGVEVLLSLFVAREPVRVMLLGLLLQLCFESNVAMRKEAILAVAGSIYPTSTFVRFRESIEESAHAKLQLLCQPSPSSEGVQVEDEDGDAVFKEDNLQEEEEEEEEVEETEEETETRMDETADGEEEGGPPEAETEGEGEGEAEAVTDAEAEAEEAEEEEGGEDTSGWTRDLAKQYCSLSYSLATKNHEFFNRHVETATKARARVVREVLLTDVDRLVLRLGPDSPILLRFASTYYDNFSDDEIYQRVLMRAVRSRRELPSAELMTHVKRHYFERNQDVNLLLPIVSALTKEEVSLAFENFVKCLSKEDFEDVLKKVLYPEPSLMPGQPPRPPIANGTDLLIDLHRIDCRDNDNLFVKVVDASKSLFRLQRRFTSAAIQRVLNAIVCLDRVPRIAMRTVNFAIMNFHDLRHFTMEILLQLVEKPAMWEDNILFSGIVW